MSDETGPESKIDTRAARIAKRETQPLRRLGRLIHDLLPLMVLAVAMAGALITFFRHEAVHSAAGDSMLAACFLLVLIVIAYLSPTVQQIVQVRRAPRE